MACMFWTAVHMEVWVSDHFRKRANTGKYNLSKEPCELIMRVELQDIGHVRGNWNLFFVHAVPFACLWEDTIYTRGTPAPINNKRSQQTQHTGGCKRLVDRNTTNETYTTLDQHETNYSRLLLLFAEGPFHLTGKHKYTAKKHTHTPRHAHINHKLVN